MIVVALAGCSGSGDRDRVPSAAQQGSGDESGAHAPETHNDEGTRGLSADRGDDGTGENGTPANDRNPAEGIDLASHAAALHEAGNYTVVLTAATVQTKGDEIISTGTTEITQKYIVETGERFVDYGEGFAVYLPPRSKVAYARSGGKTREVASQRATVVDYMSLERTKGSKSILPASPSDFAAVEPIEGSTQLGPARKYVIDSAEQLPEPPSSEHGELKSFRHTVWVDKETGIVAKIVSRKTFVQNGEEHTLKPSFEVMDLGTTEIEEPDWRSG